MGSDLTGIAFITGASSGLGTATAYAFASGGISGLSLVDVSQAGLEGVAAKLKEKHPDLDVLVLPTDVSDEASVNSAVEKTIAKFSRIDMAVQAAGVGDVMMPTHEVSVSDWHRIISVNQLGVFLCERALLQVMLKQEARGPRQGRGVIVNISSGLGIGPSATGLPFPSYVASKHAVLGLTKNDAKFYAKQGIRINAICPGWVETAMTAEGIHSGILAEEIKAAPAGRMGMPEEIADAIVFLCSPKSSYMYGHSLVVDGGYIL